MSKVREPVSAWTPRAKRVRVGEGGGGRERDWMSSMMRVAEEPTEAWTKVALG